MISAGSDLNFLDNHRHFEHLLEKTITALHEQNTHTPFHEAENIWSNFEEQSVSAMKLVQSQNRGEPFAAWDITLVSGGHFPDVITTIQQGKKFGVEVKTSRSKNWKTLGGSIMESTRVSDVERINVLFAKIDPFEVKTSRFEDVVADVAVTHSPRYLIDMDIDPDDSIFKQINVDYDTVWKSQDPFEHFRKHFEKKAKKSGAKLWYIDSKGEDRWVEEIPTLELTFYSDLSGIKKEYYQSKAFLLFPHIFAHQADYKEIAMWFLQMGIMNTSLRDLFSSGRNVIINGVKVPSKFQRLQNLLPQIVKHLRYHPYDIDIRNKFPLLDRTAILKKWKSSLLQVVTYDAQLVNCMEYILKDI